jgi:hypothetical protein
MGKTRYGFGSKVAPTLTIGWLSKAFQSGPPWISGAKGEWTALESFGKSSCRF